LKPKDPSKWEKFYEKKRLADKLLYHGNSEYRARKRDCERKLIKETPQKYRARSLKTRYKLTVEDYQFMLDAQNGRCAICNGFNDGKTLHVDHCHETGKVRKLLCQRCNTGLGKFNDDPVLLHAASSYLKEFLDFEGTIGRHKG
jgi:hypothetical protein